MAYIDGSVILSFIANYFNGSSSYLVRHGITPTDLVQLVGPSDHYFLAQRFFFTV